MTAVCPKAVELLPRELFSTLSDDAQERFLALHREQVAPKFEEWRNPHPIKCAYGGRGAGAKSRSAGSLLIQFGENPAYFGDKIRVLCVRDVQKSIKESSWLLLKDSLERLGYGGWKVTDDYIRNMKNGSYFVFNGLNDMTKDQLKSFESFDILFVEEGAPVSHDSWESILATFRKKTSEIWCLFNRDKHRDPCYELFCLNPEPSWSIIKCEPGPIDNPWWFESNLQARWDKLKERDPDEALHVYEGLPRTQSDKAIFSRLRVEATRDREGVSEDGGIEIGVDVARYGTDSTQIFKRKGFCVVQHVEKRGYDTNEIADVVWNDVAERDPKVPIKIDVGYNPGVADVLKLKGAYVVEVGFGENANDRDQYANAATEMYFALPVDEMRIPSEMLTDTLFEDLTERLYGYDKQSRKMIEPKDGNTTTENGQTKSNFKGRHGGRSPDEGDALALCFYSKGSWSLY